MVAQVMGVGATITLPPNVFTKRGFVFAGWATSATGSVAYGDGASFTMGTANVTLYATWATNPTYSVSFNPNGGTGAMAAQDIVSGSTATLTPNAFTFPGHTFAGWATTPAGTVAYGDQASFTMGNANVVLYAIWNTNPSYTVSFDSNGGTGSMPPQSILSGATVTLAGVGFSYIGHTFQGWGLTAAGPVSYTDKAAFTMGTAAVVLYAVWSTNPTYSITFNPNGGVGTMVQQFIVSGTAANLLPNGFTFAGRTFAGWSLTVGGSVAFGNQASYTMGPNNVTLYAVWNLNPSYAVTFNPNGGTGVMNPQLIVSGLSANLAGNLFIKLGYLFSGWATSATATVADYANQAVYTMGSADVTLYAVWAPRGTIVQSFKSVGVSHVPEGLMWDGTRLFVSDVNDSKVYQMDTMNGTKLNTGIPLPAATHALAFDSGGTAFWSTDYWVTPPHLFRVSMSGSVLTTFTLTAEQYAPTAMTYDPSNNVFWVLNTNSQNPVVFSMISGTDGKVLSTFALKDFTPSTGYGLCMDLQDKSVLWMSFGTQIYKISTTSHSVLDQFALPYVPLMLLEGLAMVNSNQFWVVDRNNDRVMLVKYQ